MRLDFHVHTKYSIDSIIKPEELFKKSQKLGIIPAITDHNNMECHKHLRSLNARFIPGEEIRTDKGDLIGLYLNEVIPKNTPFFDALEKIHEQGGIAYLPHMYDKTRKGVIPTKEEVAKLDIIEVFNARCPFESYNTKAEAFATENKLVKAIGSDSHFLMEFGYNCNEVPDFDLDEPKALLKALKGAKFTKRKAIMLVRATTTFVALGKKLIKNLRL